MKFIIYGYGKILAIADTLTELDSWIRHLLANVSLDTLSECNIYTFNEYQRIIAAVPVLEYAKGEGYVVF